MFVDMKYFNNGDIFIRRGRMIGFDWFLIYLK